MNSKILEIRRLDEAFLVNSKPIKIRQPVIDGILEYSAACHPREAILLLKGKVKGQGIVVEEVEIPPFAVHSYESSHFPLYMLPIDFSIVGTAHSHPSSVLQPSIVDLNHFYGRIMIITAYPYKSEQNLKVFNNNGNHIQYEIIRD
ncbi:MAG: hypothetical protein QG670_1824 [Thermoproteota archaeon]|nr:hypothetical protein [Thermoproteota archaeon]